MMSVIDQVETDRLNTILGEIRELLDDENVDETIGMLGALLLGAVMTAAEGDVVFARELVGDTFTGLLETLDESEPQLAALRHGGLN